MYLWYKQLGLNSRTPKNLKELVIFGHKMKKPTKCRTGVLNLSGASIFAALPIRSMDSFCCICSKDIYTCRKDEEVVTLLRSYAKQISINAMKKIRASLLDLAEYIYYSINSICRFCVDINL